jgi:hypothetical protein
MEKINIPTIVTYLKISGGKVNILGGHSISHSKQKMCMYTCPIPNGSRTYTPVQNR